MLANKAVPSTSRDGASGDDRGRREDELEDDDNRSALIFLVAELAALRLVLYIFTALAPLVIGTFFDGVLFGGIFLVLVLTGAGDPGGVGVGAGDSNILNVGGAEGFDLLSECSELAESVVPYQGQSIFFMLSA